MLRPMARYAAFLRGVGPTTAKMPELKAAFEAAGFTEVKTVLGSGNVVFSAPRAAHTTLERKAEAAMQKALGKTFMTIVRSAEELEALLGSTPYKSARLEENAKRVVTFLRNEPKPSPKLPIALEEARILVRKGTDVFSAYVPGDEGPVFMVLIEKTFGKDVTTRTWDTLEKVARAARAGAAKSA
jgi:uncharacterized protein (DUF1697 family)